MSSPLPPSSTSYGDEDWTPRNEGTEGSEPGTLHDSSGEEAVRPMAPTWTLVLTWCRPQPSRIGESAEVLPGQRYVLGRCDAKNDVRDKEQNLVRLFFAPNRPDERETDTEAPSAAKPNTWPKVSRQQVLLEVNSAGTGIDFVRPEAGLRTTYLNGRETKSGTLRAADTLRVGRDLILSCVRRRPQAQRRTPAGSTTHAALHRFSRPDADDIIGESPAIWGLRSDIAYKQMLFQPAASRTRGEVKTLAKVVSASPKMHAIFNQLTVAAKDENAKCILIGGETGTGKSLIAEAIHEISSRSAARLVVVNSGNSTDSILESQLFGQEAGAYTGAAEAQGFFEKAAGGFLFFDEIGDMPLSYQARLLLAIEGKPFQRVGGKKNITANVRVIAATNFHLPTLIAEGKFRQDLYMRLCSGLSVTLPPLRSRPEDVRVLATAFLDRAKLVQRPTPKLDEKAWQALEDHPWPGNVRELAGTLEKLGREFPDRTVRVEQLGQLLDGSGVVGVLPQLRQLLGIRAQHFRGPLWRLLLICQHELQVDKEPFTLRLKPRSPAGDTQSPMNQTRSLTIPSLRERPEDIPLLVRHLFLELAARSPELVGAYMKEGEPQLATEVIEYLLGCDYPQETGSLLAALEALIQYGDCGEGVLMLTDAAREQISLYAPQRVLASKEKSPPPVTASPAPIPKQNPAEPPSASGHEGGEEEEDELTIKDPRNRPRDIPKETVILALKETNDNKLHAAKFLGVSRRQIYHLIEKYHIDGSVKPRK